jgi:hypothetical protein
MSMHPNAAQSQNRHTEGPASTSAAPPDRAASRLRRFVFSSPAVYAYWLLNIAALCLLAGWIFCDGRFAEIGLRTAPDQLVPPYLDPLLFPSAFSRRLIAAILGIASLAAIGIIGGLFLGSQTHRRIRSWLAITTLVVLWLTLWLKWPALAWQGQSLRIERQTDQFRSMATSLIQDWPTIDGERPGLGLFRAYPIENPSVLLLMTQQEVPGTGLTFSTVERSDAGALRFELAGNERGAWLERHPAGNQPASFVGGLEQHYDLQRFTALGDDWFLVRYK